MTLWTRQTLMDLKTKTWHLYFYIYKLIAGNQLNHKIERATE